MDMKYDIVVIGSGPGGYVAAIRASQLGKSVAVVEKAELGGVCLNWGCIPTKALLKSAHVYGYMASAATYGVDLEVPAKANLEAMVGRSRTVAATMSKGVEFLLKKNNIQVISGRASLEGEGRVKVVLSRDGSESVIEAAHIILATGARPRDMAFIPVDGERIITSREALALTRMPQSIIVIGSGAIGCEFANFYALLGVKVTIVEYLPTILPLADEEVSKYMERSFRKLRATVMTSTTVKAVSFDHVSGMCHVEVESKKGPETLEAEVVLSAVGIKSNIENLGLEALSVVVERDKIVVDGFGRTNVAGIYAIGDIVSSPALAHVASAEAIVCVEKICGLDPAPVDVTAIPSCTYTNPEVASVGLTEKECTDKGYTVKVGRFPFTASGKATAMGDRDGFVKLIFDASNDRLLGTHMVGTGVTELVSGVTLGKNLEVTAHGILKTVYPHPTMSEGIPEAAASALGEAIHTT